MIRDAQESVFGAVRTINKTHFIHFKKPKKQPHTLHGLDFLKASSINLVTIIIH